MTATSSSALTTAMAPAAAPCSSIEMVCRLLDGALRQLHRARVDLPGGCAGSVGAARRIVVALRDSLDTRHGARLTDDLFALYDYILRRLTIAEAALDPAPAAEVRGLLEVVAEGWRAVGPVVDAAPPGATAAR